jgi:hypothetical protein
MTELIVLHKQVVRMCSVPADPTSCFDLIFVTYLLCRQRKTDKTKKPTFVPYIYIYIYIYISRCASNGTTHLCILSLSFSGLQESCGESKRDCLQPFGMSVGFRSDARGAVGRRYRAHCQFYKRIAVLFAAPRHHLTKTLPANDPSHF